MLKFYLIIRFPFNQIKYALLLVSTADLGGNSDKVQIPDFFTNHSDHFILCSLKTYKTKLELTTSIKIKQF